MIIKRNIKKYGEVTKKHSIKKTAIKFTAIGLSAILGASATIYTITKKRNEEYNLPNYSYSSTGNVSGANYVDDKIAFEIVEGEDPVVNVDKGDINIKLNELNYNSFIAYLNSCDSTYEYEDLYEIDEAISKYKENNQIQTHIYDITNGTGILTSEELYNVVTKNNSEYLSQTNNLESNFYEEISDSSIKKVCNLIVECINTETNNNSDIDKKVVFCTLKNLKILKHKISTANAFYNENGILSVDDENIQHYQNLNEDIDAYRQVIYHEAMHIIQSACPDQLSKDETEMGICQKYSSSTVNPFYWEWFLEAAAEKEMGKVLGEETNTYSAPIGYYDSLILVCILNDQISVSDLENICYEKKVGDFYKVFNANTIEDKKEIIKMMYSIEIMQFSPQDFYGAYKQKTGIDLSIAENEENLRLNLRIDILKTFSKMFYKSLSNQLLNNKITLNTVYYLINIYESDVFAHLFYNEKERINSAVDFFDYYTELQNQFFSAVAKSNNISLDKTIDEFDNYSMNALYNGVQIKNYDLEPLGKSDSDFIEKKRFQNYQTGIPTIRSMPEYCEKNGYSK